MTEQVWVTGSRRAPAGIGAVVFDFDDTLAETIPEGLELLLGRMGTKAETTLVVVDSFADIQAAHAAGCWSCLAGWGVPEGERDLQRAMPDIVAEHPSALTRLLIPA